MKRHWGLKEFCRPSVKVQNSNPELHFLDKNTISTHRIVLNHHSGAPHRLSGLNFVGACRRQSEFIEKGIGEMKQDILSPAYQPFP
jgi:hypothetical protein